MHLGSRGLDNAKGTRLFAML